MATGRSPILYGSTTTEGTQQDADDNQWQPDIEEHFRRSLSPGIVSTRMTVSDQDEIGEEKDMVNDHFNKSLNTSSTWPVNTSPYKATSSHKWTSNSPYSTQPYPLPHQRQHVQQHQQSPCYTYPEQPVYNVTQELPHPHRSISPHTPVYYLPPPSHYQSYASPYEPPPAQDSPYAPPTYPPTYRHTPYSHYPSNPYPRRVTYPFQQTHSDNSPIGVNPSDPLAVENHFKRSLVVEGGGEEPDGRALVDDHFARSLAVSDCPRNNVPSERGPDNVEDHFARSLAAARHPSRSSRGSTPGPLIGRPEEGMLKRSYSNDAVERVMPNERFEPADRVAPEIGPSEVEEHFRRAL